MEGGQDREQLFSRRLPRRPEPYGRSVPILTWKTHSLQRQRKLWISLSIHPSLSDYHSSSTTLFSMVQVVPFLFFAAAPLQLTDCKVPDLYLSDTWKRVNHNCPSSSSSSVCLWIKYPCGCSADQPASL